MVGLETVNESKGGRGNYERMQDFKNNDGNECRCNADDAMMRCNKQIKNTTDSQNKEGIWSVGLGRYITQP